LAVPIDRWDLPIDIWDVPAENWDVPIDAWDVPAENWDVPIDIWDVPAENWDVPIDAWDVPAENWDVPGDRWNVRAKRWDIPAYSASSLLTARGFAELPNFLLAVQTLLLIFDVGGSYFQTSFAVFVPALPAVVAHNSVANIIRLTEIN
jgi:hypothetical protein